MSDDSVDRVFEKAIVTIQTLSSQKGYNSLPRPPATVRIQLYALFKQSTEGDVRRILEKPDGNPTSPDYNLALRKWDAWKSKEGLSDTEAKRAYIELLIHTMKTYAMGTIVARELLSELEFMWWQITHSNSFDGNEGPEYQNETNSVLMLTNDINMDNGSEKIRKEVYETLAALRPDPVQKNVSLAPIGSELSKSNDEFYVVWSHIKRVLTKLLFISKSTASYIGKRIISQSIMIILFALAVKYSDKSVEIIFDQPNCRYRSWVAKLLQLFNQFTGINKVIIQVQ
ncbi:unnamed protein product [Kluyveromyces dobzhanskii CBS 2104]|uniref:WGS project CCBQ000000000 data, contig 00017 n=1 Tax=Kluyveromyces dobzhanskii CBS 2104 TaxID=1427455 RepID=A0A0A8L8E8_9SACH|nr:unnamed protein product [Kluyveromyces dobzhanskii CBS 2104]